MNKWISLLLCGAFLAFQTVRADVPASDDVTKTTTDDSTDSRRGLLGGAQPMPVTLYCFDNLNKSHPITTSIELCTEHWGGHHYYACPSGSGEAGDTQSSAATACSSANSSWVAAVGTNTNLCTSTAPGYSAEILADAGVCVIVKE